MFGRVVTRSLALQLLLVSYCAAQALDPGPIRVGDRWSYDRKDDLTGDLRQAVTFVAAEISQKEITTRVSVRGKDRAQTIIFDLDWGRIDDDLWKYRPSDLLGIKKPLQIGKQWRTEGITTNIKTSDAFQTPSMVKVAAHEQITTTAGAFDTFQIELTVRLVNTMDQTKSTTLNVVTWYAPAINRWVKKKTEVRADGRLRDSNLEELTEFARRP